MWVFQLLSVGTRTSLRIYHSSSSPSRPFSWLSTKNLSDSAMEKNPSQDHGKLTQDEKREEVCKGACDSYYPSKPGTADRLLPHLLNLYASRAKPSDFEIYAQDATFEDPLMRAQGVNQIKSAFYSIPKVFSESRIVDYTITENMISPTKLEILIDNKQYYKFMGRNIDMISLIKLYVEGGKVVRHEDWWDKKPLWNKDTVNVPLVGRLIEASRRGSMFATHLLMRYASRAKPSDFEIYAQDATFEDPLMRAQGVNQIKSAFYSIPKVFSESRIVDYTITENMISPTKLEILIDNKQYYKFMGRNIDMISLIKLYVEGGKVVSHEDWWDKKPLWNKDTVNVPLVGRLIEASRKGSMFATHLLMRFGKDPTP